MIVVEVELNDNDRGKYGLNNLVVAIAQSFPYNCLLMVRKEGVVRFFSFDDKENQVNNCRKRILNIYSSLKFIPIENDCSDRIMIKLLSDAISKVTSSDELKQEWNKLFEDKGGRVLDSFEFYLNKYYRLIEKKMRFDSVIKRESVYAYEKEDEDECESDIFDGIALGGEDIVDEEMFASFCVSNVRSLYEVADNVSGCSEEDWLRNYIVACNDYSNQLFVKSLNSKIAERIVTEFWDGTDNDEYSDTFDIEELKKRIEEDYICDREE